ncbi:DUF2059 domain-containing protein [cf. Phormidesmis sp. LEGE 11477]|uniref:DUF2059 domain-containing protein n=1 Tax=cf. Phormidesmis sp. LEGE 11477 TaxID=1828680 RepID=UPI00187F02FB|nr:DUF2059 domain-containing protein [cf. Phormidesmis sp. LEGE 11477]MBE9063129.1 DUF2059 domain-containing protein [cf. Phormidesmis sp. LEGE 11477]
MKASELNTNSAEDSAELSATETTAEISEATEPQEELPSEVLSPEISAETVAKVEELLTITNSEALNLQMMESMVSQFREHVPNIPDEWWDRFLEKIDYEELNRLIIPIYAQHFTIEDLDAIIAFYRTPAGQAVIEKMPMVLQDSLLVGQHWGMGIAQEIIEELEAEGYAVPDEPFLL